MRVQESSDIAVTRSEGITRIRMARPAKKNALTLAMYRAMTAALEAAEADPEVRVIALAGEPGCFCAGNDLHDFVEAARSGRDMAPVMGFLHALHGARKPILAEVAGVAIGIGTTMLLHCDLVYAARSATFSLPFVDLGLVPEAGSSLMLPAMLGHRRAAALVMLGERFDAEAARQHGIVNEVVALEELFALAEGKLRALVGKSPEALQATKALLKSHSAVAVREAIDAEGRVFDQRLRSSEAAAAFDRFLRKA